MPETPPATNALPKPALSAPVPAKPAITVPIPRVRRRKPALSRVIPPATNAAMLVTNQMPLPARPTALMAAIHALPLPKRQTCYIRNGSQSCPSEYNNGTTPCSGGTGYTYNQETTTVGSNICYKCTYSCASGWTAGSCPSGKTCTNSITSPVACYTGAQCPSDYPFTSQATCQEGGYTCTESASGSGCWKQTGSTSCPSGYSTAYQSVDNCGTSKANGWTFSSSGTSGGLVCGKCTEKTAPAARQPHVPPAAMPMSERKYRCIFRRHPVFHLFIHLQQYFRL